MHSDKQSVTIFTNPPESAVVIDDYLHLIAPGAITLSCKGNHLAQVNKDGYEPASLKIHRTWSWWVVGDIVGCLINASSPITTPIDDQRAIAALHISLSRALFNRVLSANQIIVYIGNNVDS